MKMILQHMSLELHSASALLVLLILQLVDPLQGHSLDVAPVLLLVVSPGDLLDNEPNQ